MFHSINLPVYVQFLDEILQVAGGGFLVNNFKHLLANLTDLRTCGISRLAELVRTTTGEGDGEQAQYVTVGGLDVSVSFNHGLPLLDHGAQFVGGKVHTVEVSQAVLALNFIDTKADVAESKIFALVQIGQGDLEDTALKCVIGVLCSEIKNSNHDKEREKYTDHLLIYYTKIEYYV